MRLVTHVKTLVLGRILATLGGTAERRVLISSPSAFRDVQNYLMFNQYRSVNVGLMLTGEDCESAKMEIVNYIAHFEGAPAVPSTLSLRGRVVLYGRDDDPEFYKQCVASHPKSVRVLFSDKDHVHDMFSYVIQCSRP